MVLGELKLQSSGLTLEDSKILHIRCMEGDKVADLNSSFKPIASLYIAYLAPDGKPISDWPSCPPFYRLRYLQAPTDFAAMAGKKPTRYVQEPNTVPVAYYPGNCNWMPIIQDPDCPIIITEGELKAAKACKEGFPTIGLGGVWNWRSMRIGVEWLPSLDFIKWPRRNIYICFDSDYTTNPMVCGAINAFAKELLARGAFVNLVTLPTIEGYEKVGLDDYLTHFKDAGKEMFKNLLSEAEPLGLTSALWGFNRRYVYIRNPGLVLAQETNVKITPGAFKEHLEAMEVYHERQLKSDGSTTFKAVSAAAAWIKWPMRQEASKLTYQPGRERFIMQTAHPLYNIWPGWGVKPARGDVTPFLTLIDHIFTNAEPEAKRWFLRWCAFPLQHPGVKMFSSAVIHGIKHGTGKSLIGYTLGRIYGENFTEISQNDLHNSFNDWAEGKQFVLGDDVTGSNKRQEADFLKKMITQRELRVNPKYIPSYTVPDCINYFFTANGPDSFFLEDDDRRFFIHEVQVAPLDEQFYVEYDLWLDTGGSAAVFDYMLNLPLEGFNPAAPAFRTAAKERMIANVQSDLAAWVRNLKAIPDNILMLGQVKLEKDLYSSKELVQLYDPSGHTGTTANGLGRELARAGFRQIAKGMPVRTSSGFQARYYIVRNVEKWEKAALPQIVAHLDKYSRK